jgi:choline monooxygenase
MDTRIFETGNRSAGVGPDPADALTLPGWAYTAPELFEREKESIFFRTWQYAGAASQLAEPGDYVTAQLLDQSIIVIRGLDGVLRGFHNVCSHRAHQLLEGCGRARSIVCPYHAWAYRTDGGMRAAPGADKLPNFNARFADHFVFFNLDPDAQPLSEIAGDMEREMRAEITDFGAMTLLPDVRRVSVATKANWKVMVDNYLECYHCAPAHPAFADLLDMGRYVTRVSGQWSSQKGELRNPDSTAYAVGPDSKARGARFWWLWPNTTFGMLPGDPAMMSMLVFQPVGSGETRTGGQIFSARGEQPDPARTTYINTVLGPEDVRICESVQRGLASKGYSQGRFLYDPEGGQMTEHAVHHFHRLVAETLGL